MCLSSQQLGKTSSYAKALNGGGNQAERDPNVQDSYGSVFTVGAYVLNILWDTFDLLYLFWFSKERVEYIFLKMYDKQLSFIAKYQVCLKIWTHYIDRPWKGFQLEMERS